MIDKIKELIGELSDTIDWILAGMPKPVPIPVTEDTDDRRGKVKPKGR